MSKEDFKNEAFKVFCQNDITVSEAVEITKKRLGISDSQFNSWFL